MSTETRTDSRTESFFTDAASAFRRAAERAGTQTSSFRVCDRIVELKFAGRALVPVFTPALAHLEIPPGSLADLTIHLWEFGETGSPLPSPPWDVQAPMRRGEVEGFNDGTRYTIYHPDGGLVFMYDAARGQAYLAASDHRLIPVYERAASLRPILFPWLAAQNIQYAHAAAVGLESGGALLVGNGGAGKSTTALACLDSELFYVGDDYCAIRVDENPGVYSLYNSGKASAATIERLKFLESHIRYWDRGGSEKAIFFLHETMPAKLRSHFPLRAILIPRVTGEPFTRISRASAHDALLALAPSTISQLPTADGAVLRRLAALVQSIPCWNLALGTDMKQIPQVIVQLLTQEPRAV